MCYDVCEILRVLEWIKQVPWKTVAASYTSRVINEDVEPVGLEAFGDLGKKYLFDDINLHIGLVKNQPFSGWKENSHQVS